MLRESSRILGSEVDLQVLTSGSEGQGQVPAEKELIAFAEAALGDDQQAISVAREKLEERIGTEGMVDSAAVVANFQRMVRIADGSGIPLDTPVAIITAGIRDELGINEFGSADNTPEVGFFKRILGMILTPLLPFIFRNMAKQSRD
jgi:hypothetical protein